MFGTCSDGTNYELAGPEDGQPIVFIHGLGLNKEVWQFQTAAFSGSYRTVTYDLFGHGDSPAAPQKPSLTVFSQQLAKVLEACRLDSAVIVGFSLGGMIARRFAQDYPEKTKALVILNSPHKRSKEAQADILARVELARKEGPGATVEAALVRWFTDSYRSSHPDVMNLVRRWVLANDPEIYPSNYEVLASGIDEIVSPSPPISCPALIVTGDEDYGNGPEMTRAIASEIPGSTAVVLPGLRHMGLMEDPEAVNAPIRSFLETLE
ncbi:alpha/beta fold hydrolase [Hwanghaeella grinnelliae]|uniref:Alpha/beta fold hydrolase n=1 Tax=Hwanghaeella grinnelliae TaxID=2500179 RepID=A0A3S2W8E4_9PROT|nr:alpha/beta hydrolase [Hwanghaeella grinnelliae]RVU39756.1 alpha/beta fold hydrolase [Hwanghaeella grinnelliae]